MSESGDPLRRALTARIAGAWPQGLPAPLLISVSGGPDSVALTHVLAEAKYPFEIAHIDHQTGRVSTWRPGDADQCGEPVFVPRSTTAEEGDGFLLVVIWRAETNSSDLAIFNAGQVSDGPVALAHLSHRVPAGFHGNWRGAVE